MWIFLATEVMFFGGLFCAYLIYRRLVFRRLRRRQQIDQRHARRHQHRRPDLQQLDRGARHLGGADPRRLFWSACSFSPCFSVSPFSASRASSTKKFRRAPRSRRILQLRARDDSRPSRPVRQSAHAQIFFALYFFMTGLHALHMIIGLGHFHLAALHGWRAASRPNITRPRNRRPVLALRRHRLDLPVSLLYLIDRHP